MTDLYHLSKAVYSGNLSEAQAVLDKMRAENFNVLRGRMAASYRELSSLPIDEEAQARLGAAMQAEEGKRGHRVSWWDRNR